MLIQTCHRIEGSSLTIADGDGTGFIEQQCIYVAGRFYRFTRLGDYIGTQSTIHPGNTDGRQQPSDGSWNQTHK